MMTQNVKKKGKNASLNSELATQAKAVCRD